MAFLKGKTGKEKQHEALAFVNGAMTLLNIVADIYEKGLSWEGGVTVNPFNCLVDFFKETIGYDKFLKILSKFIVVGIPAIEYGVKTALTTNIKNIISCNFNPIINDRLLSEGFTFDLRSLDLKGILNYCPIGVGKKEFGKYYYFGCDEMQYTDELVGSSDFDAVLWYVKNRSNGRIPWLGYKRQGLMPELIITNGYSSDRKQLKEDGIVTIEFTEKIAALKNGVGEDFNTQTPSNNMLRVYIGNTCEIVGESPRGGYEQTIKDSESKIKKYGVLLDKVEEILKSLDERINNPVVYGNPAVFLHDYDSLKDFQETVLSSSESIESVYNTQPSWYDYITEGSSVIYYIDSLNEQFSIETGLWETSRSLEVNNKIQAQENLDNLSGATYRRIDQNYYYRRTLLEFNTDYIWSLKLFDAKVLTAQLIDAMTNCLTIDLGVSINQQIIREQVEKMVNNILINDETVVDDRFFTFTNDEYDDMYHNAQMMRMGLTPDAGISTSVTGINAEELLSTLNGLYEGAEEGGKLSIVENCIETVSNALSANNTPGSGMELSLSAKTNFIDNLLLNLANVIVSSVISPKLYLLIAINKRMLGENKDFNVAGFIEANKRMLSDIIRSVRDVILKYLTDELMKIIETIVKELAEKLTLEQFEDYKRLLLQCIEAFKKFSKTTDWNMADVDYADILPENIIQTR